MSYERFCDFVERASDAVKIENSLVREMFAEFLGVVVLVSFGNGAVAQSVLSNKSEGETISVNFAYGLGLVMAIYVAGNVSGAHLNPAISITFSIMGRLSWLKLPFYILAQVLGGFVSGAVVFSTYYDALNEFDGGTRSVYGNTTSTAGIFATYPKPFLSISNGLWDQVVGTSLLSGSILAITDDKKIVHGLSPLVIGLLVVAIGLSYGFNCGYAINPARDLGPRLFTYAAGYGSGVWSEPNGTYWCWVPIVGPIVGSLLGAFVYKVLVGHHLPDEEEDEGIYNDHPKRTTKL